MSNTGYFTPNIEIQNKNGVLGFKKYPKFGPVRPSENLAAAVQHTQKAHNYARAPLPPVPSLSRAPSPQRPHLSYGATNVTIGAVHSASTRRRKTRKSKKSRKNRR